MDGVQQDDFMGKNLLHEYWSFGDRMHESLLGTPAEAQENP